MECKHSIERIETLGFTSYEECGKQAKFEASYDFPNDNKKTKYNVCGIHKNRLVAWAKRYKKMTGREIEINFKELKR